MKQHIYQIVGYKNSGKTTLLCRMTEALVQSGRTVGTIKHDAHDNQFDTPGTDSWKHLQAGSSITAISSSIQTAIFRPHTRTLDEMIADMTGIDVILIEGYKTAGYPKWVLLRSADDNELMELENIKAAITWLPHTDGCYPCHSITDQSAIINHLLADMEEQR